MMKKKKPALWSALIITILYIICFAYISLKSGDTLTVRSTFGDYFEPGEPVIDDVDGAIILEDYSYEKGYAEFTFRAVKEIDFCFVTVPDLNGRMGLTFALRADAKCRITDLNTGNFPGCAQLLPLTLLWTAGVLACFIIAFRKQIAWSIYSYNTAIYFGFGVMVFTIMLQCLIQYVSVLMHPEYLSVTTLKTSLAESGMHFYVVSFPVFVILTAGLIISNISLLRKEGASFTNMLGIIMGIVLCGGDIALYFANGMISGNVNTARIKLAVINGFGALFLYFACMWIGAMAAGLIAAGRKADCDRDYLVILGCGIRPDGTVTPLLKGRCDQAVRHYFKQKEAGKTPVVIPSGGQGPDEAVSESEAMKNYLLTQGIPAEDILCEDRSETTYQNFDFSRRLMDPDHLKTAFFTTNYHVFRSGIWARRAGFERTEIQGEGAPTKWYFWPNAFIREFAGLLTSHRIKQILICAGLVLAQVAVTLIFWMV